MSTIVVYSRGTRPNFQDGRIILTISVFHPVNMILMVSNQGECGGFGHKIE